MKLVTFLFADSAPMYHRMAEALAFSVQKNSPSTPLEIVHITDKDPDLRLSGVGRYQGYVHNTRKTRHHCNYIQSCQTDELVAMLDCDMMVLRDLSPAEKMLFDLAYTSRPGEAKFRINSGTIMVRPNDRTKQFYRRWLDRAMVMLAYPEQHTKWQPRYGGVNQCALASLMHEGHDLELKELSCREWNSVSECWPTATQEARVVHLLDKLRRACLNIVADGRKWPYSELVPLWRGFDARRV